MCGKPPCFCLNAKECVDGDNCAQAGDPEWIAKLEAEGEEYELFPTRPECFEAKDESAE